ncbi:MAG: sodium/proton antiporter, partial [Pseudomonadales bacterium]
MSGPIQAVTFWRNFLGPAPEWYKILILAFLLINPVLLLISPFVAGWVLVAEF